MTKPLIALPCTARELENALHAVCDHHGLWDGVVCESYSDPDCTKPCALYVVSNEPETKGETK